METRGRGPGDDGDQKAALESGGYDHHKHPPSNQSRGDSNRQYHLSMSTSFVIRKTVPYLIALSLACFLLFNSSSHIQYYCPTSYHPLSGLSENSAAQSNKFSLPSDEEKFSSPIDNFIDGNLPLAVNNPSAKSAQENLPSNTSPLMGGPKNSTSSPASQETEEDKLAKVLNRAAMDNKTVIVTTVNAAWAEPNSLFDMFLESFRIGIETQKFLNHLVVIALDLKSYNRCCELHPYCYALRTEGVDFSAHEAFYMHGDYVKLVWRKIEFMHTVLQLGYSAVFSDADIMWFRDPFLHFLKDADMQTASDHYFGNPTNGTSSTGFYFVKSNNRTLQFYDLWLASRSIFKRKHDQEVFNTIRDDPTIQEIGMKIRVLDTAFYGGFCEPSEDLNLVCTMHANCCTGLGAKLRDLRSVLEDWKSYMALASDERANTPQTWRRRRKCHG